MNVDRLLELADAIETERLPVKFDMDDFFITNRCGTRCCIGGLAIILFNLDGEVPNRYHVFYDGNEMPLTTARRLLDLTEDQAPALMLPSHQGNVEGYRRVLTATPALAAKVLRHLATTGQVDWSV